MASSFQRRKRFCKDDRVEVRSDDEGFQGSWHSGAVIEVDILESQIKYVIKYDHMLLDDESDYFIESLLVNENEVCKLRGRIRPFQAPVKITYWDISYGVCVDVYYNDAWWEGVVFDHEDGSETRNVFFPEMGDEMKTPIAHIRISQDWNDATGTWKNRGTWFFLELLEEFEDGSFHIKPKEFWFDLRKKAEIQKLGDWTSSDKQLRNTLVFETLGDKLKYVKHRTSMASSFQQESCRFLPPRKRFCKDDKVEFVEELEGDDEDITNTKLPLLLCRMGMIQGEKKRTDDIKGPALLSKAFCSAAKAMMEVHRAGNAYGKESEKREERKAMREKDEQVRKLRVEAEMLIKKEATTWVSREAKMQKEKDVLAKINADLIEQIEKMKADKQGLEEAMVKSKEKAMQWENAFKGVLELYNELQQASQPQKNQMTKLTKEWDLYSDICRKTLVKRLHEEGPAVDKDGEPLRLYKSERCVSICKSSEEVVGEEKQSHR